MAQQDLLDSGPSRDNTVPLLYRPFDVRYTYYTGRTRGFICMPRPEVMRHMLQENAALFAEMAALGKSLTDLHLLRSAGLDPPAARFEGDGDGKVAKSKSQGFRYEPDDERVWINRTQYFAPVPAAVWDYRIGGYQVCHKWLKDRKARRLSLDEVRTYCRIVTALSRTIDLQAEIDRLYPAVEGALVTFPASD